MRFLLRTLSLSYFRLHLMKTFLTLIGIVVGVATFSSIRTAQHTLVGGLRNTVDRIAGKAQLQITGASGVPEELQEKLRDLAGIRVQAPVIEQIVTPEPARLGSILVLGVDLLGDREMRDYGFEGEDADLDDPLLFLAQPDSIALAEDFAARAGIGKGDALLIHVGGSTKRVIVRGLLKVRGFAEAFGGNVAVTDVYAAQELFGRGRTFDRIDVRLEDRAELESVAQTLRNAAGPGFRVDTPERRGEQMENLIANFAAGFEITSFFAAGIGVFLIFNAFTVSVNRRRRDIGILRALGATPRQVQSLFLLEAVILGIAGAALGVLAGTALVRGFLRVMNETVSSIYGVSDAAAPTFEWPLALGSLLLGVAASVVGAWAPARNAARVRPTEALASGSFAANPPAATWKRLAIGWTSFFLAILLSTWRPLPRTPLVLLILFLSCAAIVLIAGPTTRMLLRHVAPIVAKLSPVAGRLAADSLLGQPRRTSGTLVAITLAIAFVMGVGGYVHSTRNAILRWMDDVITSDLFVRGSANITHPDFRLPPEMRTELLAAEGVAAVESYRSQRMSFRGEDVLLMTIEVEGMLPRAHYDFIEGDLESMRRGLIQEGKCTVSDNFYRKYGLGVGDTVELPAPEGTVKIPIAAVVVDYSSDHGSVLIDRSLFLKIWKDDRVDIFDVSLKPGSDPVKVREALREQLGSRTPALISTRKEFVEEIRRAVDSFYALTQLTVLMALLVASIGIASSLLISVAERTREFGILKALGALGWQIRRSVVYEALVLTTMGLLLAAPAGALLARFLAVTVAELYAGWRMPTEFPLTTFLQLAATLPVVGFLAAWAPARQAAAIKITEAISYE